MVFIGQFLTVIKALMAETLRKVYITILQGDNRQQTIIERVGPQLLTSDAPGLIAAIKGAIARHQLCRESDVSAVEVGKLSRQLFVF